MLNLTKGLVDISDPCYDRDVISRINNLFIVPGYYTATITKLEYGIFGERIKDVQIILKDLEKENIRWNFYQTISVDSGLAGFYSSPSKEYNSKEWGDFCNTLENTVEIIEEDKVISSTGLGDGVYNVYVAKRKGEIIGVKIKFL